MPPQKNYNLQVGENTFASPSAMSPTDARKLQSLIPSLAGYLSRESPTIPISSGTPFDGPLGFLFQCNLNVTNLTTKKPVAQFFFFAASATSLYLWGGPGTTTWTQVTAVGTLAGFPVAVVIDNLLHLTDGASNWIFDGTGWVTEGLLVPQAPPKIAGFDSGSGSPSTITSISRTANKVSVTITSGSSIFPFAGQTKWFVISGATDSTLNQTIQLTGTGTPNVAVGTQTGADSPPAAGGTVSNLNPTILSNRYYWTTSLDQSQTHGHESSSSPISAGTGAATNSVVVAQRSGKVSVTAGSAAIVGNGTDWSASDIGQTIWYSGGTGIIAGVTAVNAATLTAPATSPTSGSGFLILSQRATAWNVYASSSEEDKIGNLLATIPATLNLSSFTYIDQSPMIGTVGSYFSSVQRPLLNDPPNPTSRMTVHENRIWRRDEDDPNFFAYSAYEEVLAEDAGSPYESVPGAAGDETVSTQENETSLPDQSLHIRGFCSHGDSLYIGSEKNVYPLYGNSLQTFDLTNVAVFAVGFAGKKACISTPFGLVFLSYDKKVYLYPSQYQFGVDSTTALIELGRPKRPEFELILGTDFDQVQLIHYNWGRRNWLVFTYQRKDASYATWVFDFEVKGWFQLQQGYPVIDIFEVTPGEKVLIGVDTNNVVNVLDDLTGTFTLPPGANYPLGTFRQLTDFGEPNSISQLNDIQFEISDPAMEVDVTVWLDPQDPDSPGDSGIPVAMTPTTIGAGGSNSGATRATRYSGRLNASTGATCQRVLVEFAVAASPVNGTFRGFSLDPTTVEDPNL